MHLHNNIACIMYGSEKGREDNECGDSLQATIFRTQLLWPDGESGGSWIFISCDCLKTCLKKRAVFICKE
jgi:hypothetical protein